MAAPPKCPGCGTKLQPDWENCPNCPMSFPDVEPASASPLKNSPYRDVVRPALFFAALGFGLWAMMGGLWKIARDSDAAVAPAAGSTELSGDVVQKVLDGQFANPGAAQTTIDKFYDAAQDKPGASEALFKGGPGADAPSAGSQAGAPGATGAISAGDEGEGSGTISITAAPAGPRPKPVREWRLRGTVYDLVTLKPVPGCTITFVDNETNEKIATMSNAKGLYRAIVPPLPERGYQVSVSKSGYAKTYLEPGLQEPSQLDEATRRGMASDLAASIAQPSTVLPAGAEPLVTDIYLAPLGR